MTILTRDNLDKLHYDEFFFCPPALGDNLCLFFAAQKYFEHYGKKILIGTSFPEFAADANYCDIYGNTAMRHIDELLHELIRNNIKSYYINYMIPQKSSSTPFIDYYFPDNHILAEMCARIGLSGEISLDPHIDLTEDEKKFGRFYKPNQIAIMSERTGQYRYKNWGNEKVQQVVDALRNKYNFVQIGAPDDSSLQNILNLQGALSLRKVAAILYNSDLFVGCEGALMHLARCVGCRSVISYSLAEPLSLASYPCNKNITANNACSKCFENKKNPVYVQCIYNYECIRNIKVKQVIDAVVEMMSSPQSGHLEIEVVKIIADKPNPLSLLTARIAKMLSLYGMKLPNGSRLRYK
jgi:CDP-glycerol glycerophosphotransferase